MITEEAVKEPARSGGRQVGRAARASPRSCCTCGTAESQRVVAWKPKKHRVTWTGETREEPAAPRGPRSRRWARDGGTDARGRRDTEPPREEAPGSRPGVRSGGASTGSVTHRLTSWRRFSLLPCAGAAGSPCPVSTASRTASGRGGGGRRRTGRGRRFVCWRQQTRLDPFSVATVR